MAAKLVKHRWLVGNASDSDSDSGRRAETSETATKSCVEDSKDVCMEISADSEQAAAAETTNSEPASNVKVETDSAMDASESIGDIPIPPKMETCENIDIETPKIEPERNDENVPEVRGNRQVDISQFLPDKFRLLIDNEYHLPDDRKSTDKAMRCDCFERQGEENATDLCLDGCINRDLYMECGSRCPSGQLCRNRRFHNHEYANVEPFNAGDKGTGLRAVKPIPKGSFIYEYIGEVVSAEMSERRTKRYNRNGVKHHYFMALDSGRVIDATAAGSISRFINHSCDPNAATQKWTVDRRLRVGFFAIKSIAANEEITFDYRFERFGKAAQKCLCGAANCRGWIGGELKEGDRAESGETSDVESTDDENESTKGAVENTEKARKKRRRAMLRDQRLDNELQQLLSKGVLRSTKDVLTICRYMARGVDFDDRHTILDILEKSPDSLLHHFINYHGCDLLYTMMIEEEKWWPKMDVLKCRMHILTVLHRLPFKHRDKLAASRILKVVEKLAGTLPGGKEQAAASGTKVDGVSPALHDDDQNSCSSSSNQPRDTPKTPAGDTPKTPIGDTPKTPIGDTPKTPIGDAPKMDANKVDNGEALKELEEQIKKKAVALIDKWSQLKENYRIPKRSAQHGVSITSSWKVGSAALRPQLPAQSHSFDKRRRFGHEAKRPRVEPNRSAGQRISRTDSDNAVDHVHAEFEEMYAEYAVENPQTTYEEWAACYQQQQQHQYQMQQMGPSCVPLHGQELYEVRQPANPGLLVYDYNSAQYWWQERASGVLVYPAAAEQVIHAQTYYDFRMAPTFVYNAEQGLIHEVSLAQPQHVPLDELTLQPPPPPPPPDSDKGGDKKLEGDKKASDTPVGEIDLALVPNPSGDVLSQIQSLEKQLAELRRIAGGATACTSNNSGTVCSASATTSASVAQPAMELDNDCLVIEPQKSASPRPVPEPVPVPEPISAAQTDSAHLSELVESILSPQKKGAADKIAVLASASSASVSLNNEATPAASSTELPPMPPGWVKYFDDTGNAYYHNEVTQETQWTPPQMPFGSPPSTSAPCAPSTKCTPPPSGGGKRSSKQQHSRRHQPQQSSSSAAVTTAAADTSSEVTKRQRERFKAEISKYVIKVLTPLRKAGRFESDEDFKHLCRKLSHAILDKEERRAMPTDELKVNENVKRKAKDWLLQYANEKIPPGTKYKRSKAI